MNSDAGGTPWYGGAKDWAQIISSAGQAAGGAMQNSASMANSKKEAKQAKKRTISNLLNQALKRNQGLGRVGQEYSDDMNDYQSQALQNVARGFVEALHGSSKY